MAQTEGVPQYWLSVKQDWGTIVKTWESYREGVGFEVDFYKELENQHLNEEARAEKIKEYKEERESNLKAWHELREEASP